MHIKQVNIQNFKHFTSCTFALNPGMNLLIGDNGVGKSSALDAVSVVLASFFQNINEITVKGIRTDDVHFELGLSGDASTERTYFEPTQLDATIVMQQVNYNIIRARKDGAPNTKTTLNAGDFVARARELTNTSESILPIIAYPSVSRTWQTKRSDYGAELKAKISDRRRGYMGCLDATLDRKGIISWILQMELIAFQKKQTIGEYERFLALVTTFMQEMENLSTPPNIYYSIQLEDLVYEIGNVPMQLSYLSAGYQSALWLVMELAYRMVTLNPHVDPRETPVPGVVLIDELDMHLHPKWQWHIVDALTKTFPSVQFIVATHSPIVISSCKDANIILLEEQNQVVPLSSGYGMSINDVLTYRFGSVQQPLEVKNLQDAFNSALEDSNMVEAKEILGIMREYLGNANPLIESADRQYEIERSFLEG